MLDMERYDFIRTGHREMKMSISELSRQTRHSRNTIKRVLHSEYHGYSPRRKQSHPALGPYHEQIRVWLKEDLQAPKKQRHSARRIYHRLVEEHGYDGAESTVRRYVRTARAELGYNSASVFIPSDPESGFEAEVDWGTASVVVNGKRQTVKLFCMRSKYSGKHFVRVYPCERSQVFIDAHLHAFLFFGGIFRVLIYHNLTTAVRKVLQEHNRIEQDSFKKFRIYHSFEARFTNPAKGNEKGGVEGLVGYARRNYLVPIPDVSSLEELNSRLLEQCRNYGSHIIAGREHSVEILYEQEKPHLLELPQEVYSNIEVRTTRVDKYSTVIVDKNRYSVPTCHAGQPVAISLGANRVEIS